MTHQIRFYCDAAFMVICSIVVFVATLTATIPTYAQLDIDRVQRVYSPDPVEVPADRDGAFRLFFPYNNPQTSSLNNVVAELRIQGSGFVFVPDQTFDYYYPDNSTPVECNNLEEVPNFEVDVTLSSPASIVYGLQSANNPEAGSGDTVNNLPSGAQGCIRVTLALDPNVIVGQEASVYMNWYVQGEEDTNKLPPIGIYNLRAVQGSNLAQECSIDEELYDGVCVPTCRIGQIRDAFGTCVDQSTLNTDTTNSNNGDGGVFTRDIPQFDTAFWLFWIFGGMFIVSIGILSYAIISYRRLIEPAS